MSLKQIKEKFYSKHPNATAYITYNEKLNKYVCYTYNVAQRSNGIISIDEVKKIMKQKNYSYDIATVEYINKKHPNLYTYFSDFYADVYLSGPQNYSTLDSFINGFNSHLEKEMISTSSTTSNPSIYAYIINENGEIETPIFNMELTIKQNSNNSKVCIIENTFTDDDYKCAGIHGMGIKFLEAVLAEKNISVIYGKSQECDVYESSNNSSLVEHYKKLGFDVDYEADGSYTICKYVNSEQVVDISKTNNIPTK